MKRNDISKIKVVFPYQAALAVGVSSIAIDSQIDATILNIASVYRYYRYTKLKVTLLPNPLTNGEAVIAQFTGGVSETIPPASGSLSAWGGEFVCMSTVVQTVPTSFVVPRSGLRGAHNWYVTDPVLDNEEEHIQGYLYVGSTSFSDTDDVYLLIEAELEFSSLYDAAQLAANLRQQAQPKSAVVTATAGSGQTPGLNPAPSRSRGRRSP